MPVFACSAFWESDPRRWTACLKQAGAQMLAEGWVPKAGKFPEVQKRRALKLWRKQ